MRAQRFGARVEAGPGGRAVIAVPFDPDQAWGTKSEHRVAGTIDGRLVRGMITPGPGGWTFTVTPMVKGMDQFSQAGRAEAVMPGQERLGRGLVGGLPRADVHRINVTA